MNATAIVTVVSDSFEPLLELWISRVSSCFDLPIVVFDATKTGVRSRWAWVECVRVGRHSLSMREDLHAAGWKLLADRALPRRYTGMVFLDLDTLCIRHPQRLLECAEQGVSRIAMSVDRFVGYKEALEEEMRRFDNRFAMQFFDDGRFYYFNTGVWWAPRHKLEFFAKAYEYWESYYSKVGCLPAILDQNIFNYAICKHSEVIEELPGSENCLRQYPFTFGGDGRPVLEDTAVSILHFNGGDAALKFERMQLAASKWGIEGRC